MNRYDILIVPASLLVTIYIVCEGTPLLAALAGVFLGCLLASHEIWFNK